MTRMVVTLELSRIFEPLETPVLWCEAQCLHLVLIKPPSTTSTFNPPRSFSRSPLLEYYRLRTNPLDWHAVVY